MVELAQESQDDSWLKEALQELEKAINQLEVLQTQAMLSDPHDGSDCYLSINAGAGGTESCDWASMLWRMYERFAQFMGWRTTVEDLTQGDQAGVRSVTLHIQGAYSYGYLKGETGVHRLVRISPFDANLRRHTSFASVFVWPEIDENIQVEIRPEDLEIQTFRAGGAGGQHVNRTDSAVRIKHLPTGIVVACQAERSQHQNKERALKMLRALLYQRMLEQKRETLKALESQKTSNSWGHQIRSYVLHPYKLVKDHRTEYETNLAEDVLDGGALLLNFIKAYLEQTHQRQNHGDSATVT